MGGMGVIARTSLPPDPHQPAPPSTRHSQSIIQSRSHVPALCTPHDSILPYMIARVSGCNFRLFLSSMVCSDDERASEQGARQIPSFCPRCFWLHSLCRLRSSAVANKVLEPERLHVHRHRVTSSILHEKPVIFLFFIFFFYDSLR